MIITKKIAFSPEMQNGIPKDIPLKRTLFKGNMFQYAENAYKSGKKVALHNFANNDRPGFYRVNTEGNHYFITNTQEEQLLKMSFIDGKVFLPQDLYPICKKGENNTLYTENVIFKDNSHDFTSDVVTCAALYRPLINGDNYVNEEDERITLEKMILVIHSCKNADILVTGLWGCGAFCHPIRSVLRLWKQAMELVSAHPKEIVFCYYIDIFTLVPDKWNEEEMNSLIS